MRRAALLFGAGLIVGVLAMYLLAGDEPAVTLTTSVDVERDVPAARAPTAARRSVDFLELVTGSVDTTERAALYRLAADADRTTLESLLPQVAALPKLASRAQALELLLMRYGEIDPAAAATLARELHLEAAVVAPMFLAWARRDPRAALRALGDIRDSTATPLGIALLQVFGNDDLGIIRVLGAAPQIGADSFRLEAAVAKAATAPEAAVEDALLLPASKRATALSRIAGVWAKSDAHGALAHVDYLDELELKNAFKAAVLREWATYDAEAMLAYIVDLPAEEQDEVQAGAVQALTLLEPTRALEIADSLSGQLATMMRRAALMGLARDNPLAALRYVETLPLAGEREQFLGVIGEAYGRADPEAAIAWAQTSGSPDVLVNVVMGIARVDPERAFDLAFTLPSTPQQQRAFQALVMRGALDAQQTTALADRLLAQPARGPALQMLTGAWAQRAPEEALSWLLANRGRVTPNVIGQAGMNLARSNPAAAIGYLDRIPSELRANWISAVAEGYAQTDPRAAAGWVAQHRGEPGYDAAIAAVAGRTAQHDPVAAARLFDSVDVAQAPDAPSSARTIAATWARRDPPAAASWAHGLADAEIATGAVAAVASQWVARDVAAARNWATGLPMSAARDAALVQVIGATVGTPAADPALADAFSSSAAQQRGLNDAIRIIAARDVAAARQLADQYLTDPGVRRAADRFIEQGASAGVMFRPPPRVPQ